MPTASSRVCLVTGSSRGLGLAVAEALRGEGEEVHVLHRSPERAVPLESSFPGRVHAGSLDGPDQARRLIGAILEQDGRLDVLVHAVGPYYEGSLEQTSSERFRELVAGNLFTAVDLMDAARAPLRAAEGCALLFGVSGLGGQRARSTNAAYVAAKSALRSYGRSLALQEAPHGVRVNLLSPGVVPHPGASEDTLDPNVQAQVPMGRAGTPSDIAQAAVFLCSSAAGHITGQDVEVAGGYLL